MRLRWGSKSYWGKNTKALPPPAIFGSLLPCSSFFVNKQQIKPHCAFRYMSNPPLKMSKTVKRALNVQRQFVFHYRMLETNNWGWPQFMPYLWPFRCGWLTTVGNRMMNFVVLMQHHHTFYTCSLDMGANFHPSHLPVTEGDRKVLATNGNYCHGQGHLWL